MNEVSERRIDDGAPFVGKPHEHTASVGRVGFAHDQTIGSKSIDAVRHRAARDQRDDGKASGRQHIWFPLAAQRREYVELARFETVVGKRLPARQVEVSREPADSAEHMKGSDVEIGTFPLPGSHQQVDLVRGRFARWRTVGCGSHTQSLGAIARHREILQNSVVGVVHVLVQDRVRLETA